jgi:hypothetical protein
MYHRACDLSEPKNVSEMEKLIANIMPAQTRTLEANWYWESAEQNNSKVNFISFLNDLLIFDHFKFVDENAQGVQA